MITILNARDCAVPMIVDGETQYNMPPGANYDLTGAHEIMEFGNNAYLGFNQWPVGHFGYRNNYVITLTGGDAAGMYDYRERYGPSDGSLYLQGLAVGIFFMGSFLMVKLLRKVAGASFGGDL